MSKPIEISPELAAVIIDLLENPAAYALVGWEKAMEDQDQEEFHAWESKLDRTLSALGSKQTFKTLKSYHGSFRL